MKITRLGPDNKAPVMMEMTASEANVLYTVCGSIGGDPNGPRGVADAIYYGLQKTKAVSLNPQYFEQKPQVLTGNLYFPHEYKGGYDGFESD